MNEEPLAEIFGDWVEGDGDFTLEKLRDAVEILKEREAKKVSDRYYPIPVHPSTFQAIEENSRFFRVTYTDSAGEEKPARWAQGRARGLRRRYIRG